MAQVAPDTLARGRDAFERRDWTAAFDGLSAAGAERALEGHDLERLGEAARWSRHFEAMVDAFERALAAHERAGDRRSAARVAIKLMIEHHARQRDALAAGLYGRAEALLTEEGDCREAGLLRWCQGRVLLDAGMIEEARRLNDEVIELGRRLGDRDLEAIGLLDRGHALLIDGPAGDGVGHIDRAMALALTGELELWTTGTVYCSTIVSCRNRGDWRRAGEWSEASLRWCERNSLSGFPGLCQFHRAEVLRLRGDLARAELDAQAATDEMRDSMPLFAAWGWHELGEIRRRQGRLGAAREAFEHAIEMGMDPQPGLALLLLDEGKPDAARRSIVAALEDESAFAREARWLTLPAAVAVGIASGADDLAREAAAELDELAERFDTPAVRASADLARGRLLLASSEGAEALRVLRRARTAWGEVGAPYEAAEARLLLAAAHRLLGDEDAAKRELEAARAGFDRVGATHAARRAAASAAALDAGPVTTQRTFVFTDVVGSTQLVEALGDEAWSALLSWHDRALRACFEEHAGEEAGHEGDGFFVAFPDARSALACGCAIQRMLRDHRRDQGFAPSVRIGLHADVATVRGADFRGRGVHVAARIGAAAEGGEILASVATLDAAGETPPVTGRRTLELKGVADPVEVATVDWSGSE